MKNKRGNVFDIPFWIVILFVGAIVIVSTYEMFDGIAVDLNNTGNLHPEARLILESSNQVVPQAFNTGLAFLFFGVFIGIAVAAYYIKSPVAFFIISLLLLGIFAFIAAELSNAYQDYASSDAQLNDYVSTRFNFLNHLMNNYPLYMIFMGAIVLIILYSKAAGIPFT